MSDLEPLTRSITVPLVQAEAFVLFTDRMTDWWPLATHSVARERAARCAFEARAGGRIYEVRDDGLECEWGRVTEVEAPRRIVFTWHPGRDASSAQEIEVRFEPEGAGTRVTLEHTGWERLGGRARDTRRRYESGWDRVLVEGFGGAAASS